MCIVPGGTFLPGVPACAGSQPRLMETASIALASTTICRAVIDGHLLEESAKFTANILLGVLFPGIFKHLFSLPVFDEIPCATTSGGIDIHKRRFICHARGLLQIVRDDRNGVLF